MGESLLQPLLASFLRYHMPPSLSSQNGRAESTRAWFFPLQRGAPHGDSFSVRSLSIDQRAGEKGYVGPEGNFPVVEYYYHLPF